MIPMTLAQVAAVTGGRLDHATGREEITGSVEFDSRKIASGDLFLAIAGARVDGHDFAETAVAKGAAGVLAARSTGVPAVVVAPPAEGGAQSNSYITEADEDGSVAAVLHGLGLLTRRVIDQLVDAGLMVVGITGSAGKTSTKDIIASLLKTAGPTVAPPGSFNNEIGHPYTALRCTPETKYLVAELSARGIGHIKQLAHIAPPTIGVVLNTGSAHLGEFGSRENIATAKGELVEALPAHGVAVLNADDDYVAAMAQRTAAQVWFYSTRSPQRVWADNIVVDATSRASFDLHATDLAGVSHNQRVQLKIFGEHQVSNSLAAVATALAAGLPFADVVTALETHEPVSAHRMAVSTRKDGVVVVDDAYNANPESMRAGISALAATKPQQPAGAKTIAVLGPMAELGDESRTAHAELVDFIAASGIDLLVVVGEGDDSCTMATLGTERGITTMIEADNFAAARAVAKLLAPGDAVLVKASNTYQLWKVAEYILDNQEKQEK
jgi:hypothetical protein